MPSYLITGAGRGIGFGFLDHLSRDASNTVIGLVRKKAMIDAKVAQKLVGRKNIHIIEGDMSDHKSLKLAADATAAITGGSLDVLIANANSSFTLSYYDPLNELGDLDTSELHDELVNAFNINVVGNVYLTNALLPLIRKGILKKLVYISTAIGLSDFVAQYDLWETGAYSISKAALNMMVAKYHAKLQHEDILAMAISPGVVDSAEGPQPASSEEEQAKMMAFFGKFTKYASDMKGPITVEESVNLVLGVVDNATIGRNGGQLVSQFGNQTWI